MAPGRPRRRRGWRKRLALLRYVPDEKQVFRFDGAIRSVVGRELAHASIAPASWQLLAAYKIRPQDKRPAGAEACRYARLISRCLQLQTFRGVLHQLDIVAIGILDPGLF